jgi:hypothetical protein
MHLRFLQNVTRRGLEPRNYLRGRIYDVPDDLAQRWLPRGLAEIAADPSEPISEAEPIFIDEPPAFGDADFDYATYHRRTDLAAWHEELATSRRMFLRRAFGHVPVQPGPVAAKPGGRFTADDQIGNPDDPPASQVIGYGGKKAAVLAAIAEHCDELRKLPSGKPQVDFLIMKLDGKASRSTVEKALRLERAQL